MQTKLILAWVASCLAALAMASEKPASLSTDPNRLDLSFYRPGLPRELLRPCVDARPRSVILFIGDGMGFGQVTCARIKALGPDGRLNMERLPVTGILVTHSADNLVPDSAASATALACGVKTNNGMIGQTPAARYQSILEASQAKGMKTGLVDTKSITDATPAAFAAHVKSRKMEPAIAAQLLAARVNVLFGGGRRYFVPASRAAGPKDPNDLLSLIEANGYLYVENALQLRDDQADLTLGLFAYDAMKTRAPEPTLAEMTEKAIQLLDTRRKDLLGTTQGFFMMVEGSQIDTACHNNDPNQMIRQVLLFDLAVDKGIDFALKDRRTLIVVTADHETGGLQIITNKNTKKNKDKDGSQDDEDLYTPALSLKWTGKDHTGLPVPLYAFGPGALEFTGVTDNTQVPQRIARLLGIREFPKQTGR